MPLDFPTNPAVGTYYNGYIWDGTVWDSALQPSVPALLTTAPVYADAAARTTAVPSPAEGQLSYLNDINQFQGYAGSGWRGIGGLSQIVPATVRVSGGSATANTLGKVSFSGVTSIALDSVFSSTYDNYKINFVVTTSTASGSLGFRFASGGVDTTATSWYGGTNYVNANSAGGTFSAANGSADFNAGVVIGSGYTVRKVLTEISVNMGNDGNRISVFSSGFPSTYAGHTNGAAVYNVASLFDGFKMTVVAGTITGFVTVYGYNS